MKTFTHRIVFVVLLALAPGCAHLGPTPEQQAQAAARPWGAQKLPGQTNPDDKGASLVAGLLQGLVFDH